MRKIIAVSVALLLSLISPSPVSGQTASGFQQTWGPVAAAGPLGTARNFRVFGVVPSNYTIDWFNDGTPASFCTFQVEGSSDNVHWHALTGVTDCTASDMLHIAEKPVMYLRINILSYSQGDSTTAVIFNYTRGA